MFHLAFKPSNWIFYFASFCNILACRSIYNWVDTFGYLQGHRSSTLKGVIETLQYLYLRVIPDWGHRSAPVVVWRCSCRTHCCPQVQWFCPPQSPCSCPSGLSRLADSGSGTGPSVEPQLPEQTPTRDDNSFLLLYIYIFFFDGVN